MKTGWRSAALALTLLAAAASAQDDKSPLRLLVGLAPGGANDIADKLKDKFARQGLVPAPARPEELAAMLAAESKRLALLVSCVGRKLVMGGRVEEEIEAVGNVFGRDAVLAGFYSNGEISPVAGFAACKLHNQTMTVTLIAET